MTKNELRKSMLLSLKTISPSECLKRSRQAWQALMATLAWAEADAVLAYTAMDDELDSEFLLSQVLKNGKELFLPRIEGQNLIFCHVTDLNRLEKNRYGFDQPMADAPALDIMRFKNPLLIAPCLAANRSGYRLGRGAGYYDRFLTYSYRLKTPLTTVVAAYKQNITDSFVQERHDQPFHFVLSEMGIQRALAH